MKDPEVCLAVNSGDSKMILVRLSDVFAASVYGIQANPASPTARILSPQKLLCDVLAAMQLNNGHSHPPAPRPRSIKRTRSDLASFGALGLWTESKMAIYQSRSGDATGDDGRVRKHDTMV